MKLGNNFLFGGAIIGAGLSLVAANMEVYNTDCVTFQGYEYNDGEITARFDGYAPLPKGGGDKSLENLNVGDAYRLKIRDHILPVFSDTLLSYEKCDKENEVNYETRK